MGKREPLVKYKKGPEIATERHLLGMMSCPTWLLWRNRGWDWKIAKLAQTEAGLIS